MTGRRPADAGTRVLVLGDALLDRDLDGRVSRVAPDAPVPVVDLDAVRERPGGAGLAARLLARPGIAVTAALALGRDPEGHRLAGGLERAGIRVLPVARTGATRTVSRVRGGGHCLVRVDRAGGGLPADAPLDVEALADAVQGADAVLVADYGGGAARHPAVLAALARRRPGTPVVWDPHPRGGPPPAGCTVVTPNQAEAAGFAGPAAGPGPDQLAGPLRERWQAHAVAVTAGGTGVFTALADSPPLFTPTPSQAPGDPVGAGDRFAGTLTAALAGGAVISEAVGVAVHDVAGWLWAGGVATLDPGPGVEGTAAPEGVPAGQEVAGEGPEGDADEVDQVPAPWRRAAALARRVRAGGGTVVATGGCFDVLHAGHVECLQAARRLGDCLVVLLNSDRSVSRLKGPDRPVHPAADRRRVLEALDCVDAVAVFDDDTPAAVLRALRPDIWAKGGDYASAALPEAALLPEWGGRPVLLPYLAGRSTTRILARTRGTDRT